LWQKREKPEENRPLGRLVVDGRIMLKLIFSMWDGCMGWIGVAQDRDKWWIDVAQDRGKWWIDVAQDRDKWWILVNALMNFRVT
jgi:hypothetical protein